MKASLLYVGLSLVLCCASVGLAVPTYDIVTLGYTDSEHTLHNDTRYSYIKAFNDAGQVVGYSDRISGMYLFYLGRTAWIHDGTTRISIGQIDNEHTRDDGYRSNTPEGVNEAGQVIGTSQRFNNGSTDLGLSAWSYDGISTRDIGLAGNEYTQNDGYKYSNVRELNEAGQVTGYSYRYNGSSTQLGLSAWLYDGTTTFGLGLTGTEHTRSDGYKYGFADEMNQAGQVRGYSYRYSGGSVNLGQSAWFYDGTTTSDIGLVGGEHTRNDGYKYSVVDEMNEAGQVLGKSSRFNGGSADMGSTVWLTSGAITSDIGLTGSEYTRNDGYRFSQSGFNQSGALSEAGQVVGHSRRFNDGSTDLGRSAWIYDGLTTTAIGLYGIEHTRNDGYKDSTPYSFNESGRVCGASNRYNGGSIDMGQSAWLYDGTNTINIGLTDGEHTRGDGYRFSVIHNISEEGEVIGSSNRYSGGTHLGSTLWLYKGATTIDIGLADSEHTRIDGYRKSEVSQMQNEAGQIAGWSDRYNGGSTKLGRDAWFYDPILEETFAFRLSTRSDGYADSFVTYLGEDGLVLGLYTLFDGNDNDRGFRPFYFTIEDGLHDLASLVGGGLAANSWDWLGDSVTATSRGEVLGYGQPSKQPNGFMPYLLTPVSADFDDNENVDDIDLAAWEAAYGVDDGGDANHDGVTDGRDFLIWQRQFDSGPLLKAASEAVPEPGAVVLCLMALVGLVSHREVVRGAVSF